MKYLAVALLALGCKGKADQEPSPPAKVAAAPSGSWTCEATKREPPSGRAVRLGDRFVRLHGGMELKLVSDNRLLGSIPLPERARIRGVATTKEGLAIAVWVGDGMKLARFDASGAAKGLVDLQGVPGNLPGFLLDAFDDTLVVFQESGQLAHAAVQLMDLDGKPIGERIDSEHGKVGQEARIATSHVFATFRRNSEGAPDALHLFDADKRAWVGAETALDQTINGTAPFGGKLLLYGVKAGAISHATVDASGALSPWERWSTPGAGPVIGGTVATSADGKHTFASWATDKLLHAAEVGRDLTLGTEATVSFDNAQAAQALVVTERGIDLGLAELACK